MKVTIEQNNGETMVVETDAFALVAHDCKHDCNEARTAVLVNGNATPVAWAGIYDGLEKAKTNIYNNNPIVGMLVSSKDALSEFLKKLEKQEGKENEGV